MGGQLLAVWFVIDALEAVNVLMVLGLVFASFWFGLDLVVVVLLLVLGGLVGAAVWLWWFLAVCGLVAVGVGLAWLGWLSGLGCWGVVVYRC